MSAVVLRTEPLSSTPLLSLSHACTTAGFFTFQWGGLLKQYRITSGTVACSTLIKLATHTSLYLFSILGQILSAVIHDISFLLYLLSLLQMKSLCNPLPFQVHPFNCYYASLALNPSGNQPMVVLLFPEGQTPHSCAPRAISSFQQLPRVYVMLVMFSSCRAQRACCSAKRNPKGKESE